MKRTLNFRQFYVVAALIVGCNTVAQSAEKARWSELSPLPAPVSGHFAGVSHGAIMTAGGAHFPVPLFEGGTKKWVPEINILAPKTAVWSPAAPLPHELAYGASVSDGKSLICIGGGDAQTHNTAVFRLEWKSGALKRSELPSLPKPCAFLGAALLKNTLYVAGGQETPTATEALSTFWALDLKTKNAAWRALETWPGPGRILPVMAVQNDAIYLFSGAQLNAAPGGKAVRTYLADAYCYRPGAGWARVAAPPRALVAAPSAPWGKDKILVFGGDDGALAARVQELKDAHPGFSRDVLAYDTKRDSWTKIDTLPLSLVTTNALRVGQSIVIPGGEDRPGHRNPRVLRFAPQSDAPQIP